jgi:hypothetical protein
MSGAIPLLPQYTLMAWTETNLPFYDDDYKLEIVT